MTYSKLCINILRSEKHWRHITASHKPATSKALEVQRPSQPPNNMLPDAPIHDTNNEQKQLSFVHNGNRHTALTQGLTTASDCIDHLQSIKSRTSPWPGSPHAGTRDLGLKMRGQFNLAISDFSIIARTLQECIDLPYPSHASGSKCERSWRGELERAKRMVESQMAAVGKPLQKLLNWTGKDELEDLMELTDEHGKENVSAVGPWIQETLIKILMIWPALGKAVKAIVPDKVVEKVRLARIEEDSMEVGKFSDSDESDSSDSSDDSDDPNDRDGSNDTDDGGVRVDGGDDN